MPVQIPDAVAAPMDDQRGFTLLQVLIAIVLILVALLGVARVLTSTSKHHAQSKATSIAMAAMRDKIAEIQDQANRDVGQLLATYTSPAQSTFPVPAITGVHDGLTPLPGNTAVGAVLCWNDETGVVQPAGASPGDSARLGLPRDLNMDDDDEDAVLVSDDMKVVPIKVTLDFLDVSGPRHLELFYLAAPQ